MYVHVLLGKQKQAHLVIHLENFVNVYIYLFKHTVSIFYYHAQ